MYQISLSNAELRDTAATYNKFTLDEMATEFPEPGSNQPIQVRLLFVCMFGVTPLSTLIYHGDQLPYALLLFSYYASIKMLFCMSWMWETSERELTLSM